jgi:hypothetical protein
MLYFFPSKKLLLKALTSLATLQCPQCGAIGFFKRHGYIRGWLSPNQRGIRAWRIYCNPRRGGCGHAPSLRLNSVLPHRCLDADTVWVFLICLLSGGSVKAAWEAAHTGLSLDCAYRLLRAITRHLVSIRTLLWARAPPPPGEKGARTELLQTILHFKKVFGETHSIRAFQQDTQSGFLGRTTAL